MEASTPSGSALILVPPWMMSMARVVKSGLAGQSQHE
jgi:hypothetical protein